MGFRIPAFFGINEANVSVRMWGPYSHDMTRHSYTGNIGIIALANIFGVNLDSYLVTWTLVDNGIATVINPVVPEQPPTRCFMLAATLGLVGPVA